MSKEGTTNPMAQQCELCGKQAAEHFVNTPWGERHICTRCAESLPAPDQQNNGKDD
jgi:hypothetical protein